MGGQKIWFFFLTNHIAAFIFFKMSKKSGFFFKVKENWFFIKI